MSITTAELLAALSAAREEPLASDAPNTYSGPQIRLALGIAKDKFPATIGPLVKAGTVRVVKVRKQAIDGRWGTYPAYQVAA